MAAIAIAALAWAGPGIGSPSAARAQAGPAAAVAADPQAAALWDSAKQAYADKQYAQAADRFRQYVERYPKLPMAAMARFGQAVALLENPRPGDPLKDHGAAVELLKPLAADAEFIQQAAAAAYLGTAQRGLGERALSLAAMLPNETAKWQAEASTRFSDAATHFAAALALFEKQAKATPPTGEGPLPEAAEQAARARADLAQALLRTGKVKEAVAAAQPFASDPILRRSGSSRYGRYALGHGLYLAGDAFAAGRTLASLAPFADAEFGLHTKYLLARVHHQSQEWHEALALYDAVAAEHEAALVAARAAVGNPAAFAANPRELARLDALIRQPLPEHVAMAMFHSGVAYYEMGMDAQAVERLSKFLQLHPKSPLVAQARLRVGLAQARGKQWAPAQAALAPLIDDAKVGVQARWWLARAILGAADRANAGAYAQAVQAAGEHLAVVADRLDKSGDKAGKAAATLERGDAALEFASAGQGPLDAARKARVADAIAAYQALIKDNADPAAVEAAWPRLVLAAQLAGDNAASDGYAAQYLAAYPHGAARGQIVLRQAENALALAQDAAAKDPKNPDAGKAMFEAAAKRYADLLKTLTEADGNEFYRARKDLGVCLYKLGDYEKAAGALAAIPATERVGDMAIVAYLHADSLIRSAPADATDAIAAGRLLQSLGEAAKQLEAYIPGAQGKPEQVGAMLKLADCQVRVAALMADANEKAKLLASAFALCDAVKAQFPAHPQWALAELERARIGVLQGAGSIERYTRFAADPRRGSPVAPLAFLRLASFYRSQGQPAPAAAALAGARDAFEAGMLADPARAAWAPMFGAYQGDALREAGDYAGAKAVLADVIKRFPKSPHAAEAQLRLGQCQAEEARKALQGPLAALVRLDLPLAEGRAAIAAAAPALANLRAAATALEGGVATTSAADLKQRLSHEAGWAYRWAGDFEGAAAAFELRAAARAKTEADLKAAAAPGQPVPPAPFQAIAMPSQPSHDKATSLFKAAAEAVSDSPLSMQIRFDLAELQAERGQFDPAIAALGEALDLEPPTETAERMRLRLGLILLDKGDVKAAADQFAMVAASKTPALAFAGILRAGEAKLLAGDAKAGVDLLLSLRDKDPYRNHPGIEWALFRLGQGYAMLGDWNNARANFEQSINRTGDPLFRQQARFGMGHASQQLKQWDPAVNNYQEAARTNAGELAAEAQYQVGLCHLERKQPEAAAQAFEAVAKQYAYPQWSAPALLEAGKAWLELKKPEQAKAALKQVVERYPDRPEAAQAKQRMP